MAFKVKASSFFVMEKGKQWEESRRRAGEVKSDDELR